MTCPTCQTENPDQARFCHNCGTALEAARPVEGERKRVAVLFADVVGSTGMAERLDPEEVVEIMNGAFAFMTAAVARYEGTVARLMGDAVLAFFGAPVAHEDDAERAVRAALDIRDDALNFADQVQRRFGVAFSVRVGIDSGLVVAGEVGSTLGTEYTAMGDTPNIAARLQAAAEPGSVLISEATHRLVGHVVDVHPRGGLDVKGRTQPIETFEVKRLKSTRGTGRGLEGVHSPLVGREAEFARLRSLAEAVRQGVGAMVAVVGEAGLGKSRLVTEVRKEISPRDIRWLEGRGLSYGQSLAYYPWRQVLRQSVGAQETDTPETIRERLQLEVCTCCRRPGGDIPFLESILAIESEESLRTLATIEGQELIQQLGEAVEGYLCSLAQLKPTVVVFDDLHWADQASLDLLVRMAEVVKVYPLLFVLVLRPEKAAASWSALQRAREALESSFVEIPLEPLAPAQTRELLGNLLHIEDLPESIRATILQKAEGNPFFLEEVLRSLIDTGHIVREADRWHATRDIVRVTIPDTLSGVLSARIDRLPEVTKRVAQTAAVLGRIFEHEVLMDICHHGPPAEQVPDIDPHLRTLTYEELVRERAHEPALEYIFKHALTQEAAYDLLLVRRRKELHRRAGEALERVRGDHVEDFAPLLARHFFIGEEWQRAARHARRAGRRAAKLFALDEAMQYFQMALDALDKLPAENAEERVDVMLEWTDAAVQRRVHERVEGREDMLDRLDRVLEMARELDDQRRIARVLVTKGNVLTLTGRPGSAFPLLIEASDLATTLDDESLFLLPFFAMSESLVGQDPRRAVEVFEEVIRLAQKHRDRGIEAHALAIKASAHARLGEFELAREFIERALELAPGSNSAVREADVLITAGMVYYDLGEVEKGIEYAARGGALAHSVDGIECACAGYAYAGLGELQAERPENALRELGRALALAGTAEGDLVQFDPFLNQVRAWRALAMARHGDASTVAPVEEALTRAVQAGDDFGAAFLNGELGEIYLEHANYEKAEQHLQAALSRYRERGMRPYVARTLTSLAVLHERSGRPESASEIRIEAQAVLPIPHPAAAISTPSAPGAEASPLSR
jgi:class 3 adenylate cyclase/tetratricopeptide (TPR) repeat protein